VIHENTIAEVGGDGSRDWGKIKQERNLGIGG
jgi:hypothetical protein